jgi:hypothetical protein
MHQARRRLLVGGVAGLVALGVGGGAALAAHGNGSPQLKVQAADATQSRMPLMPTAMSNSTVSGPSPSYHTSVRLHTMPAGTVTLWYQGTRLEATISAIGFTPGSTHVAEITSDTSEAPIVFSQFTASSTGQVDATAASLEPVTRPRLADASFQLDLSTSPAQPIARAYLRGDSLGDTLLLQAVEPSGPGELAGHATLDYDSQAKTLAVTVDAAGFVPNTSHAAHVHMGSCAAQGAPIYMLMDLQADGRGRIYQRDVIRNLASYSAPSSGWYLNIHEGSSSTILDVHGSPPRSSDRCCAPTSRLLAPPGRHTDTARSTPATMQTARRTSRAPVRRLFPGERGNHPRA